MFDDNDVEFYALGLGDENKITEINMELRSEAHEEAIMTALSLLSDKCGLGSDRFKFDRSAAATATEIVSERSELFQNLRKHELLLEKSLRDMVCAVARLEGVNSKFEVTIGFDDSIIEDTAAEKQQFLQEIRDGVRQKWEYRVRFMGEDESAAKAAVGAEQSDGELMGLE